MRHSDKNDLDDSQSLDIAKRKKFQIRDDSEIDVTNEERDSVTVLDE